MKKRIMLLLFGSLLALALAGCGKKDPPDLTGEWETSNDTFKMVALVTDSEITIKWNGDDMTALYWKGTYEAPTTADEPYSWTSQNTIDDSKLNMYATDAATKVFTYEDGELSFQASALGTDATVKMKQK